MRDILCALVMGGLRFGSTSGLCMGAFANRYVDVHDLQVTLRDVFVSGFFDADVLYTVIPPEPVPFLNQCKHVVCDADTMDCLVWNQNQDGVYSIKAGYKWLMNREDNPIHLGHP